MEKAKKKYLFPVIFIILLLVLGLLVFKIAYNIFANKSYNSYQGSIKAYSDKIKNINEIDFKDELDDKTIGPLVKALQNKSTDLGNIKIKISSLNPTDKYKKEHTNLISGLENNILVYKQVIGILNNPKGSDLEASSASLNKYRDNVKKYYKGTADLSSLTLSESFNSFIDKIIEFAQVNSRANKENEIKTSQREDFISSASEIINEFINVKKDFYTDAYNTRNANGDLKEVLSLIDNTKYSFKGVKANFSKISVPSSDAYSTYDSLKKLLYSYDSYLQSISYAVNLEIAKIGSNTELTASDIDSIYKDSKNDLNTVDKNYSTLVSSLENLKNKK